MLDGSLETILFNRSCQLSIIRILPVFGSYSSPTSRDRSKSYYLPETVHGNVFEAGTILSVDCANVLLMYNIIRQRDAS
jgi:hypothetical protein